MPKYTIPWSAMLPIAVIAVCVNSMSVGTEWYHRYFTTGGKPRRMAMDYFDYVMAERDENISGNMYNQQSHPFEGLTTKASGVVEQQ